MFGFKKFENAFYTKVPLTNAGLSVRRSVDRSVGRYGQIFGESFCLKLV